MFLYCLFLGQYLLCSLNAMMSSFPKIIYAALCLIAANILETVIYPSNTVHWLSFHACERKKLSFLIC